MSNSGRLFTDKRGVVFLEFLIAFVPMWTFFLCVLQLAFVAHANLMVRHSADSAARSAVVVLPDDPNEYGGEPEMSVDRNPVTASDLERVLGRIGVVMGEHPSADGVLMALSQETLLNLGRSRLNTIRLAAHIPLMPLAPVNVGRDPQPSIGKAIGNERKLLSALYYQPFALAVTFPGLQGGEAIGPEVTVRVTYAYQCTVPLARRILCQGLADIDGKEDLGEAFFPLAQSFVGGRFRGLRHETTLMIHDAPYEYRPRGS
ncbi:MAG: TadE family protein [Polyangiales bacterium]